MTARYSNVLEAIDALAGAVKQQLVDVADLEMARVPVSVGGVLGSRAATVWTDDTAAWPTIMVSDDLVPVETLEALLDQVRHFLPPAAEQRRAMSAMADTAVTHG